MGADYLKLKEGYRKDGDYFNYLLCDLNCLLEATLDYAALYFGAEAAGWLMHEAVPQFVTQYIKSGDAGSLTKPNQLHHFLTDKNKVFTPQFQRITNKYGLSLDDFWNKELLPHIGRHPNAYHQYMLEEVMRIDKLVGGNVSTFMEQFNAVKQTIIDNPDMLYKVFWGN